MPPAPVILLEDVIMHPALSGLIGLFFLIGTFRVSTRIFCQDTVGCAPSPEAWCGYFLLLGLLASAVHVLAQLGYVPAHLLAVIGWGLCLVGFFSVAGQVRRTLPLRHQLSEKWVCLPITQRVDIVLIGILLGAFLILAMTPPTDTDSLNYHLVLPLEFLRFGHFVPHPEWNHALILGLGEYLILVGYAIRTENLSAMIQFSGVVAMLVVLTTRAKTTSHRILVAKLVVAIPMFLFLVPNQKPQLAGSAALVIAASLLTGDRTWNIRPILLVIGATLFACGLKYSFYLTGSGIFLFGLIKSAQSRRLGTFLGCSVGLYLVSVFPIHLSNFLHYSDPIPPVLTAWATPEANPQASTFYARLNQVNDISWYEKIAHLLFPESLGRFTFPLGVGIGVLLFVRLPSVRKQWMLGTLTLYALAMVENFGTYQSRYYLDTYMLGLLLFAGANELRRGTAWYSVVATGQLLVVTLAAVLGAAWLAPGMASPSSRLKTMENSAEFYPVAAWVNEQLPADALILNGMPNFALFPRETLSVGHLTIARKSPQQFVETVRSHAANLDHVFFISRFDPTQQRKRPHFLGNIAHLNLIATVPYPRGSRKIGFYREQDVFYVTKLMLEPADGP